MCSTDENPEIVWYDIQDIASWHICRLYPAQHITQTHTRLQTDLSQLVLCFWTWCCSCHGWVMPIWHKEKHTSELRHQSALIWKTDPELVAACITHQRVVIYSWTGSQALPFLRPLLFTELLASGWARVGYLGFPAAVPRPRVTFSWISWETVLQF